MWNIRERDPYGFIGWALTTPGGTVHIDCAMNGNPRVVFSVVAMGSITDDSLDCDLSSCMIGSTIYRDEVTKTGGDRLGGAGEPTSIWSMVNVRWTSPRRCHIQLDKYELEYRGEVKIRDKNLEAYTAMELN